MADVMLQSHANGDWGYEIGDGAKKQMYFVKLGIQTIPESHMKIIKKDPGYQARVKKGLFKELKPAEIKKQAKAEAKTSATEKELADYQKEIVAEKAELVKNHETQLKTLRADFEKRIQTATESRAMAETQVKALNSEKLELTGRLAGVPDSIKTEVKKVQDASNSEKAELNKTITAQKKEIEALKTQLK